MESKTQHPQRTVAVIDIGTTAVRMTLAEIHDKNVRILDFLQQAVSLGKDTFMKGKLDKASIEECVKALRSFKRTMNEHGITRRDQIRAVATTAVREAENRDAFLDRVYMATGIEVDVLDEADTTRLTYLSVQPYIQSDPLLSRSRVLVAEVGGGSTELLMLQKNNVNLSSTYRLGSLRMHQTLESLKPSAARQRELVEGSIDRLIAQIKESAPGRTRTHVIALGGDARFAANQLLPRRNPEAPARISVAALARLTNKLLSLSVDEIERAYHIPFQDAETVAPALLTYLRLAEEFGMKHITVSNITMRHGILQEMAGGGSWTDEFKEKILHSAREVGQKYHVDRNHAAHVADLSLKIFHELGEDHVLSQRHALLLNVAALMHDMGLFISSRNHHKHSMYLIQNSEIFGLSRKDIGLVSLIARYHRRASPKSSHEEYMVLDRSDRLVVSNLAAILRVADALDVSHSQWVRGIVCSKEKDRFVISIPGSGDLALEEMALKQKGPMFEEVYGMSVALRKLPA